MFSVDGRTQPAVCLLHKQIAPSIAAAVALSEFKLLPVLEASAEVLALQFDRPLEQVLSINPIELHTNTVAGMTPGQLASQSLWFANLNTPEDVAQAEAHLDALDT
jgi:molybdopterin-guanine dinucleotide biosynthesis protein A